MQDTPHADVFNNQIKVGDFVIYAASLGRSPILKVAIILELRTLEPKWHDQIQYKVSVRTAERVNIYNREDPNTYKWSLQKKGSPITLEFTDRMVKVSTKKLPIEVRALLKGK